MFDLCVCAWFSLFVWALVLLLIVGEAKLLVVTTLLVFQTCSAKKARETATAPAGIFIGCELRKPTPVKI